MQYNLLYYGEVTTQCTQSNNGVARKDPYLKTILQHVKPDILVVNEMGCNKVYGDRIVTNCLNIGTDKYKRSELQQNGFQGICNMLFYNSEKLGLLSQFKVQKNKSNDNLVRVIDIHQLYVKGDYLKAADTVKITPATAHLKAGSTSNDARDRADMTESFVDFVKSNTIKGNMLFAGDFNIKSSSEQCYKNLLEESDSDYKFHDPVNRPGSWNNRSSFADLHTQSTRSSGGNSCFSSGGMDDRFDFILIGDDIKASRKNIKYIPDSYRALGQDGNRLNGSIDSPVNNSEPLSVISALYNMSDHLPVILDLEVSTSYDATSIEGFSYALAKGIWIFQTGSNLKVRYDFLPKAEYTIHLMDLSGRSVFDNSFSPEEESGEWSTPVLVENGMYLITIHSEGRLIKTQKVWIK